MRCYLADLFRRFRALEFAVLALPDLAWLLRFLQWEQNFLIDLITLFVGCPTKRLSMAQGSKNASGSISIPLKKERLRHQVINPKRVRAWGNGSKARGGSACVTWILGFPGTHVRQPQPSNHCRDSQQITLINWLLLCDHLLHSKCFSPLKRGRKFIYTHGFPIPLNILSFPADTKFL